MPSSADSSTLSFKIKLLSGKNVVLVDCPGFESELFMPQIVKGRINFQNIIPNHRCCDAAAANVRTDKLILPAGKLGDIRILVGGANTPHKFSYSEMLLGQISGPLARSTPANGRSGKENVQTLTPEQVRCRPTQNAPTHKPLEILGPSLETSVTLQQHSVDYVPFDISEPAITSPPRLSPCASLTQSRKSTDSSFSHKAPPARTYSRRKFNTTSQPKEPISWSPLQKKKRSTKVSSTKPLSPTMKLEVRHRKLIVDNKKSIAPNLQQVATKVTKSKIRRMQVTGKTRVQFEALKETAYDHLTLPGHSSVSSSLAEQFKAACLDKYSETLPNYAELSKTDPLQMDRQVKTLIAKEKRLEKQNSKSQPVRVNKSKFRS